MKAISPLAVYGRCSSVLLPGRTNYFEAVDIWRRGDGVRFPSLQKLFAKKHGAQEWNDATGWQLKTGGAHEPKQDDIPF